MASENIKHSLRRPRKSALYWQFQRNAVSLLNFYRNVADGYLPDVRIFIVRSRWCNARIYDTRNMYDPCLRQRGRRVMNKNISRPVKQTDTIGRHMYTSIFLFVSILHWNDNVPRYRVYMPRSAFSIPSLDQIAAAPARAKSATWSYRFSARAINNLFPARVTGYCRVCTPLFVSLKRSISIEWNRVNYTAGLRYLYQIFIKLNNIWQ